jgi:hypothetical protein
MKRKLFAVLLVLMSALAFGQNTSDFEIQGNDDGTMTILNYKGLAKDIVIPEKIFNMPVTRLREGAFKGKELTKVVIPSTVTFIGDETFSTNKLTSVTIPEAVEYIGNSAFSNNQFVTITIPSKVTVIGNSAFQANKLTSINIPNSVVYIGNSAFSGEYYGNTNQITNITLGTGIKYIGSSAFQSHRTSSIIIPDNVVFIGAYAFWPYSQNSLTTITIGKYVMFGKDGRDGAFYNNGDFDTVYQNTDKRAGTYTYANGNWSFAPRN